MLPCTRDQSRLYRYHVRLDVRCPSVIRYTRKLMILTAIQNSSAECQGYASAQRITEEATTYMGVLSKYRVGALCTAFNACDTRQDRAAMVSS